MVERDATLNDDDNYDDGNNKNNNNNNNILLLSIYCHNSSEANYRQCRNVRKIYQITKEII
jgi:hypothetical protein